MQTTFKLFISCFFGIALFFTNGCAPSLTPAEQAEVDPYITQHGKNAIVPYLKDTQYKRSDTQLTLKYLKYFISKGADVNADALHAAAVLGDVEIVKFLVSKGADLNEGVSLYGAIHSENLETVKFLVSKGANVNKGDVLGAAARRGNVEIVEFLVSKGANVNQADRMGGNETPLHRAVDGANIEVVKFLVSKGANVNAKRREWDGKEVTPLELAQQRLESAERGSAGIQEIQKIPNYRMIVEYLSSIK